MPDITFDESTTKDTSECCLGIVDQRIKYFEQLFKTKLRAKLASPAMMTLNSEDRSTAVTAVTPPVQDSPDQTEVSPSLFGTPSVVDLGASQTVIGNEQVPELLNNLTVVIQKQVRKTKCNLIFKFGNHQTLPSTIALLLPLAGPWIRIAIVEGKTPFLLSSSFLKHIKAVIDTEKGTLWSKKLNRSLEMTQSAKNLLLLDINQLCEGDQAQEEQTPEQAFAIHGIHHRRRHYPSVEKMPSQISQGNVPDTPH